MVNGTDFIKSRNTGGRGRIGRKWSACGTISAMEKRVIVREIGGQGGTAKRRLGVCCFHSYLADKLLQSFREGNMKASIVALVLAAAVAASGFGTAIAQDALQVIEKRQGVMKQQGRDLARSMQDKNTVP